MKKGGIWRNLEEVKRGGIWRKGRRRGWTEETHGEKKRRRQKNLKEGERGRRRRDGRRTRGKSNK